MLTRFALGSVTIPVAEGVTVEIKDVAFTAQYTSADVVAIYGAVPALVREILATVIAFQKSDSDDTAAFLATLKSDGLMSD